MLYKIYREKVVEPKKKKKALKTRTHWCKRAFTCSMFVMVLFLSRCYFFEFSGSSASDLFCVYISVSAKLIDVLKCVGFAMLLDLL